MSNTNKTKVILFSALGLLLVAAVAGLFIYQHNQMKGMVEEVNFEKEHLASEFQTLMLDFNTLKPENDSLLIQLDQEQQKVAQLLEELKTLKASNASKLKEYRKELETMRTVLKSYVFQIDSLSRLNETLVAENVEVKKKYKQISSQISQLEKEKDNLNQVVSKAAQLMAGGFTVSPTTAGGKKTTRISKTEKLEVSFTIDANVTATTGDKIAYMRITDPKNELLSSGNNGTFLHEGKTIEYSAKKSFEYEGDKLTLTVFYAINRYIFEGEYHIDLFCDGNRIGSGSFTLN